MEETNYLASYDETDYEAYLSLALCSDDGDISYALELASSEE